MACRPRQTGRRSASALTHLLRKRLLVPTRKTRPLGRNSGRGIGTHVDNRPVLRYSLQRRPGLLARIIHTIWGTVGEIAVGTSPTRPPRTDVLLRSVRGAMKRTSSVIRVCSFRPTDW